MPKARHSLYSRAKTRNCALRKAITFIKLKKNSVKNVKKNSVFQRSSFLLSQNSSHLLHIHEKIDLIREKEIFRRNQHIMMQYSCFRFDAIISTNTEKNLSHSRPIPLFAENVNVVKRLCQV